MTQKVAIYRFPPLKTALALVMLAVLLALGTWQLQRLAWKQELLARMDSQMQAEPMPLPAVIDDPKTLEYKPVSLHGRFLIDYEFLLQPRVQDGRVGYHLVMPFKVQNGPVVFVDRGWTDDAGFASFPRPTDIMTIKGMVTLPRKTYFTPDNNPERNEWYWGDVGAFAKAVNFKDVSPVLVSTVLTKPDIPNNHQQYAIFWFCMAGIFLIVFILSCRIRQGEKV